MIALTTIAPDIKPLPQLRNKLLAAQSLVAVALRPRLVLLVDSGGLEPVALRWRERGITEVSEIVTVPLILADGFLYLIRNSQTLFGQQAVALNEPVEYAALALAFPKQLL
jgi:hypothetical protein